MAQWFKFEIDPWEEGTDVMLLDEEAAYLRLCLRIYRTGKPVPACLETLARIWRMKSTRKAKDMLHRLEWQHQKIWIDDGMIYNARSLSGVEEIRQKSAQARENGKGGGRRAKAPHERSAPPSPPSQTPEPPRVLGETKAPVVVEEAGFEKHGIKLSGEEVARMKRDYPNAGVTSVLSLRSKWASSRPDPLGAIEQVMANKQRDFEMGVARSKPSESGAKPAYKPPLV